MLDLLTGDLADRRAGVEAELSSAHQVVGLARDEFEELLEGPEHRVGQRLERVRGAGHDLLEVGLVARQRLGAHAGTGPVVPPGDEVPGDQGPGAMTSGAAGRPGTNMSVFATSVPV